MHIASKTLCTAQWKHDAEDDGRQVTCVNFGGLKYASRYFTCMHGAQKMVSQMEGIPKRIVCNAQ